MDRLFIGRSEAIARLLRIRTSGDDIEGLEVADAESKLRDLDLIGGLILDLRAGRIRSFELGYPKALEVFVTDD
jgi:hypothetical protein